MDDLFDDDIDDEILNSLLETENQISSSAIKSRDFKFPFQPYDIQLEFMETLYKCLENKHIGLFQSPTGTGKSLSLACGALTWLHDYNKNQIEELDRILKVNDVDKSSKEAMDWLKQHEIKNRKENESYYLRMLVDKENNLKKRLIAFKKSKIENVQFLSNSRKQHYIKKPLDEVLIEDVPAVEDDLIPSDYDSDENTNFDNDTIDPDEIQPMKIFFCSRTHSQLSQFIGEIKKTDFAVDCRLISLASRQNLCINPNVKKLESLTLINDRCIELQKNAIKKNDKNDDPPPTKRMKKSNAEKTCPYYKKERIEFSRDTALTQLQDIEELIKTGNEFKSCPYYASKAAIQNAQIICLPYNTLLHQPTRQRSGIDIKNSIIIIDEAHNLIETIQSIYGTQINGAQLNKALSQLQQYHDKFRGRLKANNLLYVKQLIFILSNFIKILGGKIGFLAEKQILSPDTKIFTINDFLSKSQLDEINFFKVYRYCTSSQIARKLHGFMEHSQTEEKDRENQNNETNTGISSFLKSRAANKSKNDLQQDNSQSTDEIQFVKSSPLMIIESFLEALTTTNDDGRILICKENLYSKSYLKFLLLNPALYIKDIISEARSIIVAGGTMQPFSDFIDRLFIPAGVKVDRITKFECGHVIHPKNVLPIIIAKGPSNSILELTYENRQSQKIIDEIGHIIKMLCNIVPGGIVIFFASYDYEKIILKRWSDTKLIEILELRKKIFREPPKSNMVEKVLNDYKTFIQENVCNISGINGALMFCVVGGKLNEGINFSDDLGRCVIMIGMPYPNLKSIELKEKMNYLNSNMIREPKGKLPGQIYYENLCLKAVNQSIGRSIRHKNDYSAILLLDNRYNKISIKSQLPKWIGQNLVDCPTFGHTLNELSKVIHD